MDRCDSVKIMSTTIMLTSFEAQSLINFVPAVARLFCLSLLGSFLMCFTQNKVELCICRKGNVQDMNKRQGRLGCVNTALAYEFCLALPAAFTKPGLEPIAFSLLLSWI